MPDVRRPKMIDLFCGIGLGALGFVRAGFEVAAAVDIDTAACELYEENVGVKPLVGDLGDVKGEEILRSAGLARGEAALCVGCPPCQAFSSLRRTSKRKGERDNRKSLLRVFADRVEEILPRAVVLENVSGLARGANKRFLREFVSRMEALRYKCSYAVLDAASFGVPQRRRRLILIGVLGAEPSLPKPTHVNPKLRNGKLAWITVKEAIGDLPPLDAGESDPHDHLHRAAQHGENVLKIIERIPLDGGSRRDLPKSLWLPCHKRLEKKGAESVYGRLSWNAPSGTITTRANSPACGRFVHPEQNRGLTLRETARLQSAPDTFSIRGFAKDVGMWIGNGMPPLLAEAVGLQVLTYL